MLMRFLAVTTALLGLALAPPVFAADWRAVAEPVVGFSAELPGEPVRRVDPLEPGDARGDITLSIRRDDAYFSIQISQAAIDLGDPKAGTDLGVTLMKEKLPGVRILSDDISEGDVFVRRTVGRRAGEGMVAQVTLIRGRTLIIILYLQTEGDALTPEAERFLDSLKLDLPTI